MAIETIAAAVVGDRQTGTSRDRVSFFTAIAICILLVTSVSAVHASGGGGSSKPQTSGTANYTIRDAGDITYVQVNTMMLQIFKDFRAGARIALGLDFETKSGDEAKVIKALPKLQAKYTEFVSQRGGPIVERGKLRLRFLRNSLQKITDRTIGKGVTTVLIREAIKL